MFSNLFIVGKVSMSEIAVQIPKKRKGNYVAGPGRPAGVKNKRTLAMEAAMEAAKAELAQNFPPYHACDAHQLLVTIYQNPTMPVATRIDAARAALRVEKPALAATALTGDMDVRLANRLDTALARLRGDAVVLTVSPVPALETTS
jgi:hypothetical protein